MLQQTNDQRCIHGTWVQQLLHTTALKAVQTTALSTTDLPILLADLRSNFSENHLDDSVNPNESGAEKMVGIYTF